VENFNKDLLIMENNKVNLPPIPQNLWDKYTKRLKDYQEKRKEIHSFIKTNLIKGIDYGISNDKSKKKTLLKPGAEKIAGLIECRFKIYPDYDSWSMLGKHRCVYYVAYLIDQNLLSIIIPYLIKVGFEHEQKVVKLFSWGEGRGAYAIDELVYGLDKGPFSGKPLKGSENRAVKLAEKRAIVDLVIRTFGLEFTQDMEEYETTGHLKNDYVKKKNNQPQKGMINVNDFPEENKNLFQNIMSMLNHKENNKYLWSLSERQEMMRTALEVNREIDKLRKLHSVITESTKARSKHFKATVQNNQKIK
jgi:hypothetical protein